MNANKQNIPFPKYESTERNDYKKTVLIFLIKVVSSTRQTHLKHHKHLCFDLVVASARSALRFTHCSSPRPKTLSLRCDLCNWSKHYVGIVNVILIKKSFTSLSVHPIILSVWFFFVFWIRCDTWITGFTPSHIKIYRAKFHTVSLHCIRRHSKRYF